MTNNQIQLITLIAQPLLVCYDKAYIYNLLHFTHLKYQNTHKPHCKISALWLNHKRCSSMTITKLQKIRPHKLIT